MFPNLTGRHRRPAKTHQRLLSHARRQQSQEPATLFLKGATHPSRLAQPQLLIERITGNSTPRTPIGRPVLQPDGAYAGLYGESACLIVVVLVCPAGTRPRWPH